MDTNAPPETETAICGGGEGGGEAYGGGPVELGATIGRWREEIRGMEGKNAALVAHGDGVWP